MRFADDDKISCLRNTADDIIKLFELFCGEEIKWEKSSKEKGELQREKNLLTEILTAKYNLAYEQVNELLLLLNQDRISKPFFDFFFGPNKDGEINLDQLREGVKKFRGYALLKYGNFRFAFKALSRKNDLQCLLKALRPYSYTEEERMKCYELRSERALNITKIPKHKTWLLGYLTGGIIEKDIKLAKELNDEESVRCLLQEAEEYQPCVQTADINTDIYMTWDYMDVYVATSMRGKWEYESCYDFIEQLFSHEILLPLKLRYFDPTQCVKKSRIDKGLLESFMLKRADCTIYLAQEAETLGKDSELAATLAQGKPVIVYVPKESSDGYYKKIEDYPSEFFRRRLLQLDAEEFFSEPEIQKDLQNELGLQSVEAVEAFLIKVFGVLDAYVNARIYNLLESKRQQEVKLNNKDIIDRAKKLLAFAESVSFERKAISLREKHPLAIQVNLSNGVANGVFVVRSIPDCAELLYKLLTNSMEFRIEHDAREGITKLIESISKSPYRVVTDNMKLTNSFWNFYLT